MKSWRHLNPAHLPPKTPASPAGPSPNPQGRPGAPITRLQGFTNLAKDLIDDARGELDELEYEVFAETVALALWIQKP